VVNLSPAAAALPTGAEVLLASAPLTGGQLPPDATAWLRLGKERDGA
jgi:alpha-glucosidase